jgi:predicted RNase H-like HicB family nuclease
MAQALDERPQLFQTPGWVKQKGQLLEPDDTGGYVATCPSLPGCYSQGDTIDGALDNIREAIELCLEDMQAHGEIIPDPWRVLVGSVVVTR